MAGSWEDGALGVAKAPPLAGVDAAISAWTADQCKKALGQELTIDEGPADAALRKAAKGRKLGAWRGSEVSEPVRKGTSPKAPVEMVKGEKDV